MSACLDCGGTECICGLRNENRRLRVGLKDAYDELVNLTDGEACDHGVGVCWCGVWGLLAEIEEQLDMPQRRARG